jgi:hypothetical protein
MKSKIHEYQRITCVSKKILTLFILATTFFSCSNDDTTVTPPKVLQKVVFYLNSPNQRQWNFSNNLLTNITLADGTVVEEFTYDNLNRVIRDAKYTNGIVTDLNVITYTSDSKISTINGLPYTFDATTRTYAYSYGSGFTIDCQVNSELLATNFIRTGTNPAEYHMSYANGNMTSFQKVANGTTEILKNFRFYGASGTNPVHNAVLAVARVKSLTDPGFFVDSQASTAIADGFDKGSSDPYYYNYGQVVDKKYLQIGIEVLDSNNNPVSWYPFAEYYYE